MTVALVCLATHRATRLVTRDAIPIFALPRQWIDARWGIEEQDVRDLKRAIKDEPELKTRLRIPNVFLRSLAYLVTCDWCTSIWMSAFITTFAMIFIGFTWPWWILLWLTASTVTGLIAQREPD